MRTLECRRSSSCSCAAAPARAALNVVTSTEDLADLAREVGGDRVKVESLARGYQDPHFVEAKPSFILKLAKADLLVVVGRDLEIGWLPPLVDQSRNARIRPGADGYLDASLSARILDIPTGPVTRAMGDVHPLGNPHYWLDPGNGRAHRQGDRGQARTPGPRRAPPLRRALRRLRQAARRGGEALGREDGAVQGAQGRHVPQVVAQLRRALLRSTSSATSSRDPGSRLLPATRSS